MHKAHSVKALAGVATALALTLTLPAQADVRRFTDARGDTPSSVDIRSVVLDNSTTARHKVIVVVRQDDVRVGDSIDIYLDTRPRNPGPEYLIGGATASEAVMSHVDKWKGVGREVPSRCGYRLKIHEVIDVTRAVIPRRCLAKPGRVRVAVKATRGYPVTSRDWAKAKRTWFAWVAR